MKIIRKILFYSYKYAPLLTSFMFLLGFIQAFGKVMITISLNSLLDYMNINVVSTNYNQILMLTIILFSIVILTQLINGIQNYLYDIYIRKMNNCLSYLFSDKLNDIEPINFLKNNFLNEINKARTGMLSVADLMLVIGDVFTYYIPYFVFVGAFLYHIQSYYVLLILFLFVPILFCQWVRMNLFSKNENEVTEYKRKFVYFDKCFSEKNHVKEIRTIGFTKYFKMKYLEYFKGYSDKEFNLNKKMIHIEIGLNLITLLGYLAVLLCLVVGFYKHVLSLGNLSAIFISLTSMFNMMEDVIRFHIGNISQNIGKIKNFIYFLDKNDEVRKNISKRFKVIEFNNVSFTYPDGTEALNNINFDLKENECIAIVGKNGSGKTTLSKLLLGIYEPSSGEILVDNMKCRIDASALFQNYQKYKLTEIENICISKSFNTEDFYTFVKKYKELVPIKNVETFLGLEYGGEELSLGQWQRLSLLRSFYKNSNLIVFDEPTAAIDPLEENQIYEKIEDLKRKKTIVMITHHMGSIHFADKIVVMDKGSIKEFGTFDELMKMKGEFYTIFTTQSGAYVN